MSEEIKKDAEDALRYAIYSTGVNYGKSFFDGYYGNWATGGYITTASAVVPNSKITFMSYDETKEKEMNKLYNVTVVDYEGIIRIDEKVVAKTEEEAKFKVDLYCFLKENEFELEDVDVFVTVIGMLKNRD